jgi:hypothetical protein
MIYKYISFLIDLNTWIIKIPYFRMGFNWFENVPKLFQFTHKVNGHKQ